MTLNPVVLAIWLTILATFTLSVWKGGTAERWAGSLVAAGALSAYIIHRTVPEDALSLALLFAEFLLACGFLALAVRYVCLWLGAAMMFQAVQFTLHAWYLLLERPRESPGPQGQWGGVALIISWRPQAARRARDSSLVHLSPG